MKLHPTSHPTSLALRLALGFALLATLAPIALAFTYQPAKIPQIVRVSSVADLQRTFSSFDYSLASARRDGRVPRLSISDIAEGWNAELDTARRKQVFFETILPLVLIANESVSRERQRLLRIAERRAQTGSLAATDRKWLRALAKRYRVDWPETVSKAALDAVLVALYRRVGPVPPSLALSQAAIESAYGTSRFATAGNALFGQWTLGKGLTPARQNGDKSDWSVARFASPLLSVEAYLKNLNSHRAYRDFRLTRERMVEGEMPLSGAALAKTLSAYSEKGAAYTDLLGQIIRTNRLASLDRAALETGKRTLLVIP